MFLVPKSLLRNYIKDRILVIEPPGEVGIGDTFYYFHLGDRIQIISPSKEKNFVNLREEKMFQIPPHALMKIWSKEHFTMGNRLLGLFSSASELVLRKGLSIIHSLSLDPGYSGYLELGLKNETDQHVIIKYGDRIGKILFFDVADTYVLGERVQKRGSKYAKRGEGQEFTDDEDYYPLNLGDA